jgi:hypothetical protein
MSVAYLGDTEVFDDLASGNAQACCKQKNAFR